MRREWFTDRLLLRQLGPHDAAHVREYGLRSREFHREWEPLRPPEFLERDSVRRRLVAELQLAEEGRMLAAYLSLREQPERIVGRVALNNIVRGVQLGCSVGYALAPDVTGRGYMTEGLNEMVRVAFDELGLHRVEVDVIPRNERSIGVVTRCGFEREGFSPRYLRINGQWEDHIRFAKRNLALEQG